MKFFWVFLGGGLGSLARFSISLLLTRLPETFPYPTLISNVTASFILGIIAAYVLNQPNHLFRYLLIIGFCGGFSTFSSFSFETFELFKNNQLGMAMANIVVNTLVCISAIFLGLTVGKNFLN